MYKNVGFGVDKRKKRKALKAISKINVKKAKGFVKFCYYFTIVMRVVAVLLGIVNIIQAIRLDDSLLYIMLLVSFGFPYGLSYLPWAVYHFSCIGDYHFRSSEQIILRDYNISYSYVDDRLEFEDIKLEYTIPFNEINKMSYCEKTRELSLEGDSFIFKQYKNGKLVINEITSGVCILNVFTTDLVKLLKEKVFQEVNQDAR